MAVSIDTIYQRLGSPRDDASFFKTLGDDCRTIGHESKNENLTETAFYQVASTMTTLYRDKRISLSTYYAITSVYLNWGHFRREIGNNNGWNELANKGLTLTLQHLDDSEEWKYGYLTFLYDIFENIISIEERWQHLTSSFLPYESIGKFSKCTNSPSRGILLMETAFLMEKRGMSSDVKSSITLIRKAAETLRCCYDNHLSIDSSSKDITTTSALKMLSDYYHKNQARYCRFDEDMASRIEELLKIDKEPVAKPDPSVPKGGRSTHPGLFFAIIAGILLFCFYIIYRSCSSNTEVEVSPKQEQVIPKESIQGQTDVETASVSLPSDLTGLYFVPKADGVSTKGITARISGIEDGRFDMAVYSNMPIRHYKMTLNRGKGLFQSEELGDGYITYDEQTKSITINFSDLWILTN